MKRYEQILRVLLNDLRSRGNPAVDESAPVLVDRSMGRVSRGDAIQVQQMALEMKRRLNERVQRVESALLRISHGTYGICVRCGEPVGEGRLDALPEVVLCVDCASAAKR